MVKGHTSWRTRNCAADLSFWLSITGPQRVQGVIRAYVDSLDDERIREIVRASKTWPSYYRQSLYADQDFDEAIARGALLSLFSAHVRALETLPQQERRRFLQLCELPGGDRGMVLLDDPDARERPRLRTDIMVALVLVVGLAVGAIVELVHRRATEYPTTTFIGALPQPVQAVARRLPVMHFERRLSAPKRSLVVPQKRRPYPRLTLRKTEVRHVTARRINHPIPERLDRPRRLARARHVTMHHRRMVASARRSAAPKTEAIIAGLYAGADPDADVLSVVVVRDNPGEVVADVTSRQDDATIVDRLMLAPRGRSFDIVATERLSEGSSSARACFVRGVWRTC